MTLLTKIKKRLKSKFYHLGVTVLPLLVYLQSQFPGLREFVGANYNIIFIGLGALIILLRELTTKKLDDK